MDPQELLAKISELTKEIEKLPRGYISQKAINGKVYYYHQWSENGQKKSRYLKDDELAALSVEISRRKELQAQLKRLRSKPKKTQSEVTQMQYVFMHQRIAVCDIELDDATGSIRKIGAIHAPEHLPVGVPIRNGMADRKALNDWWTDRCIPESRSGVREAMETLNITSTRALLVKCYGLSLSDQYWICPKDANLSWDEVNFFTNPFSDDIGDVLFGADRKGDALNLSSPDNTSDGNLKKRWRMIDGKRCLVKGGSNPFRQQPFNEVIATGVMECLGIPHVPYTVAWNKGAPYSICEDFADESRELVPAWRIIQMQKKPNNISVYQHFVNCCEAIGVRDAVPFLDRMIVLDYLIANEDRHLNNFGLLRNSETLEWLGFAPIYDSGSSLGYDKVASQIRSEREVGCKPFKNHHAEQIKLVSDFSWIDFGRLSDVKDLIIETLTADGAEEYMDAGRIEAITESVERRIRNLSELAMKQTAYPTASTEDDVEEDIAEDYTPKMTL